MDVKLNEPQKRYGAFYFCTDRFIGKKCPKPLKPSFIVEWTNDERDISYIESIYYEWFKDQKVSVDNKDREEDVCYGHPSYMIVDYLEKKIIKKRGIIPTFSNSRYNKLRLMDNLFTSDEMRVHTREMGEAEYIGWLEFKYGSGKNAIVQGENKPTGTRDEYEEYIKSEGRRTTFEKYLDKIF